MVTLQGAAGVSPAGLSVRHRLILPARCRQHAKQIPRPTGERTARTVSRNLQSGWIRRPTENDSPSPIRWERTGPSPSGSGFVRAGGVRVTVLRNPKLSLHESLGSDARS